jgi:hypothetical protein
MKPLLVDSATCYQLIQYFSTEPKSAESWNEWDRQCAVRLTTLMIGATHVSIAPGPDHARGASQDYGFLTAQLMGLGVVTEHVPRPRSKSRALRLTEKWCAANKKQIIDSHEQVKRDPSFPKWLEWTTTHALEEHILRLGGPFSESHIPLLADLLGSKATDIKRLRTLSTKEPFLREVRNRRVYSDSAFNTVVEAYVLSAQVRAIHHELIARSEIWQVCHHPLRDGIIESYSPSKREAAVEANVSVRLAEHVLDCAWAEQKLEQRLVCWAENLGKIRSAIATQNTFMHDYSVDEAARREAEAIADRLKLRNYSGRTKRVVKYAIEMGTSSAIGVGFNFALSHFHPSAGLDVKTIAEVSGGLYSGLKGLTAAGEGIEKRLDESYQRVTRQVQKYRVALANLASEPGGRFR